MSHVRSAVAFLALSVAIAGPACAVDDAISARARAALHQVMATEHGFLRVHAAEVLIAYGERDRMRKLFEAELAADEASDSRVAVWRALAAASRTAGERAIWYWKMEQVVTDPTARDRSQAIEALCKLGHRLSGRALGAVRVLATTAPESKRMMPLCALALAGESDAWPRLAQALQSSDARTRMLAAFALGWLRPTQPEILRALAGAADREPPGTAAYPYLIGTALGLGADPKRAAAWQSAFDRAQPSFSAEAIYDAFHVLLPRLTPADIPRLAPLLDAPESDTRVAAARSILYLKYHENPPPEPHA